MWELAFKIVVLIIMVGVIFAVLGVVAVTVKAVIVDLFRPDRPSSPRRRSDTEGSEDL